MIQVTFVDFQPADPKRGTPPEVGFAELFLYHQTTTFQLEEMFLPLPLLSYIFSVFNPRLQREESLQIWAKTIEECPPLRPRPFPPLAVWDL